MFIEQCLLLHNSVEDDQSSGDTAYAEIGTRFGIVKNWSFWRAAI